MKVDLNAAQHFRSINRRLQQTIGENAAEEVGEKWSLPRFMMANWGNKINELEKTEKEEDEERARPAQDSSKR